MSKRISKAYQTPNKTARQRDEVQSIDNLMCSYSDFNLKDIPQVLEYFDKDDNFIADKSTSTVPFPYPKFYVETYSRIPYLQSEALQNGIYQHKQEVSTDWSWSDNTEDSNASRITYLKMVMGNADPYSNLQIKVRNSVTAVG